jgi:Domain of unknown function (DUF4263)
MAIFQIDNANSTDAYKKQLFEDFQNLLDNKSNDENSFQDFFEKNPMLVPGGNCVFGESGHAPYLNALITQPSISGLMNRIPDFIWFAKDSLTFNPVFIEIEAPNKKVFNKNGTITSDFTQARTQLLEWKSILQQPQNIIKFYDEFNLPLDLRKLTFNPSYVLIYGRRNEFENNTVLIHKRSNIMGKEELLMSYDRIDVNPKGTNAITATVKNSIYIPKYISPITTVSEAFRELYEAYPNLDKAIDNSMYISLSRKQFIKSKIKSILATPKPIVNPNKLKIIRLSDYTFE